MNKLEIKYRVKIKHIVNIKKLKIRILIKNVIKFILNYIKFILKYIKFILKYIKFIFKYIKFILSLY